MTAVTHDYAFNSKDFPSRFFQLIEVSCLILFTKLKLLFVLLIFDENDKYILVLEMNGLSFSKFLRDT